MGIHLYMPAPDQMTQNFDLWRIWVWLRIHSYISIRKIFILAILRTHRCMPLYACLAQKNPFYKGMLGRPWCNEIRRPENSILLHLHIFRCMRERSFKVISHTSATAWTLATIMPAKTRYTKFNLFLWFSRKNFVRHGSYCEWFFLGIIWRRHRTPPCSFCWIKNRRTFFLQ